MPSVAWSCPARHRAPRARRAAKGGAVQQPFFQPGRRAGKAAHRQDQENRGRHHRQECADDAQRHHHAAQNQPDRSHHDGQQDIAKAMRPMARPGRPVAPRSAVVHHRAITALALGPVQRQVGAPDHVRGARVARQTRDRRRWPTVSGDRRRIPARGCAGLRAAGRRPPARCRDHRRPTAPGTPRRPAVRWRRRRTQARSWSQKCRNAASPARCP